MAFTPWFNQIWLKYHDIQNNDVQELWNYFKYTIRLIMIFIFKIISNNWPKNVLWTRCLISCIKIEFNLFQLINLAQWRYSNQWPFREVELLLVENFNQYPARLTWNTVIRCNFCPVPSGTNNHLHNRLTQYVYPKLVLHREGCYIITR